ncbi:hypothetical protein D4764_0216970 [Takifugu flavidus]|uniref:Uncharacterized protein n=1 Tax=Takifugu flavidus TaxID=433684 RepID=A0A5C6MI78_9TELE|nr:hypothetical protein D4764_0216970 [Takifugu flavidus]
MVKKELSRKAKLSIYQSIYVPVLTYGHQRWVITERTRSRIQAAEMSFLPREAGLSLRDRRCSGHVPLGGGLVAGPGLSGEITSLAWLRSGWGFPRRADGSGRGEGCLGTLLKLLPPRSGSG